MISAKNKAAYEKDICGFKGKAKSIVFPESIAEIENLVKTTKTDIIPRGAGTSFVGGCVPNNSIVLDISKMNKILDIDDARKMVYVEAGVSVDNLNLELEKYGLELPITPMFSGIQTIGGLIALNATGSREIKYGRTRNWIESLEIIDHSGELTEISKTNTSDFAGMEGITGIIVRAKMRLTLKKIRTLDVIKSDSISEILEASNELKLNHEVTMIEMIDQKLSLMLGLENKYHLFIEYEGNQGNMKGRFYEKFMKIKNKAYYVLAYQGFTLMENPKFFMDSMNDFILFLEQNKIPYSCNLGSRTVTVCFKPDGEIHSQALELIQKIRAKVSYNLGIGLTKKKFLDKTEKELIKRIKMRHDPDFRFNRDKVIDYDPEEKVVETKNLDVAEKQESQIKEGDASGKLDNSKEGDAPEKLSNSKEGDAPENLDNSKEGDAPENLDNSKEGDASGKLDNSKEGDAPENLDNSKEGDASGNLGALSPEQEINEYIAKEKQKQEEEEKVQKIVKDIMGGGRNKHD